VSLSGLLLRLDNFIEIPSDDWIVDAVIEGRGCELAYLSPYSPDTNPIEEAFSKVKGLLRKARAQTREGLIEAMGPALAAVGPSDARGFFEHSGYRTAVQPFRTTL
jgi:hypothetical protein